MMRFIRPRLRKPLARTITGTVSVGAWARGGRESSSVTGAALAGIGAAMAAAYTGQVSTLAVKPADAWPLGPPGRHGLRGYTSSACRRTAPTSPTPPRWYDTGHETQFPVSR